MPVDKILTVFSDEIPKFDPKRYNRTFDELGVDSFDLITIRAGVERAAGRAISDDIWTTLETPAQILALFGDHLPSDPMLLRTYSLNMPQMALGGMSESWLFKEMGDAHWSLITEGLGAPSGALVDGTGARLYATFTRFSLVSSAPLVHWDENEKVDLSANITRFGAGVFFSRQRLSGNGRIINAEIMSSFSRRGAPGSNTSLQRGQPEIPPACAIEEESGFPEFGHEYRARRGARVPPAIFETVYDIMPYHDINGVGLLYFAAYPIISDICELRYRANGNDWAERASTIYRDVFYFANCDMKERVIYRLHGEKTAPGWVETESSLSRESDGAAMAYIITRKAMDDA